MGCTCKQDIVKNHVLFVFVYNWHVGGFFFTQAKLHGNESEGLENSISVFNFKCGLVHFLTCVGYTYKFSRSVAEMQTN